MKKFLAITAFLLSVLTQPSFAGFKVHEWGTFTSVQGSNGETLSGLEHEEEELPAFVHNREPRLRGVNCAGMHCTKGCCKGMCCEDMNGRSSQQVLVTQKMETPVLYFYSDKLLKADVTVDFPNGLISQYYPQPTSFLPALGENQGLKGGQIHYSKLEVLTEAAPVPEVVAGNVYGPARGTKANFVRMQDETEKFIFYRGLGNFKTALKITSDAKALRLQDTVGNGIPYMLAVNIQDRKGSFKVLGSLAKGEYRSVDLKTLMTELTPSQEMSAFERNVGPALVTALVNSGLYQDEAQSMVNTWRVSYFHTNGLRVLYVLPRQETDAILPLKISPQPEEVVRTLVGRIEVMTKLEEDSLLSLGDKVNSLALGRFQEPKLLRIKQLSGN